MRKFEVRIVANQGTADHKKFEDMGLYTKPDTWRAKFNQYGFAEVLPQLPQAFRDAFNKAAKELDSHWDFGTHESARAEADLASFGNAYGDDNSTPVRKVSVPVEGFPDTTLEVIKYHPFAYGWEVREHFETPKLRPLPLC